MTALEKLLDRLWRTFPPSDASEYAEWRERLDRFVRSALKRGHNGEALSAMAALVTMADAVGDDGAVITYSNAVVTQGDFRRLETVSTVLFRLKAFHRLGRHDEERTILDLLPQRENIWPEDLVVIFEALLARHPGAIPWTDSLADRLATALGAESFKARRSVYVDMLESRDLDKLVLTLGDDLRRWNMERASEQP